MNQQNQIETNNPSIQSIITENSAVAESLSDLPLTGEQAGETKGGAGNDIRVGDRFTTTVVDPW